MTDIDAAAPSGPQSTHQVPSTRRSAGVGLVDQVFSSVSNALILIAFARVASPADFGTFAILMTVVTAAIAIGRGGIGTPIMLAGRRGSVAVRSETRGGLMAAMMIGLLAAGCLTIFAIALSSSALLVPIAVATVLALQQDSLRYCSLSHDHGRSALISDGVWMIVSLAVLGATAFMPVSPTTIVWGWTVGAGLASAILYLLLRISPSVRDLRVWWSDERPRRLQLTLEACLGSASAIGVTAILALVLGAAGVAALRGAGTILGPLSLFFSALPIAIIPRAVRLGVPPRETWTLLRRTAIVMCFLAIGIGVTFAALPITVGSALLGDTWAGVSTVILFTGLEYAGLAWLFSCWAFLKTFAATKLLLATRSAHLCASAALAIIGALVTESPVGAAMGLAAASILAAAVTTLVTAARARGGS